MDSGYKPAEDYVVSGAEQLGDADITRSDELWLIQCPIGRVCL